MSAALPLDKWPAADDAVAELWALVEEVDSYVNGGPLLPAGWSTSEAKGVVAQAKECAQTFSDMTEKVKRGEGDLDAWRAYPDTVVKPLVESLYEDANFTRVEQHVSDAAGKVVAAFKFSLASAALLGLGLLAVVLLARR